MKHTISITQLQRQMREFTTGLIKGDEYILTRNGEPLAHVFPMVKGHAPVRKSMQPDPNLRIGHKEDKPFRPLPPAARKLQEDITGKQEEDEHLV